MADSSAEKTQEPTPKRLREAREKGELPRSRELATFAGVGVVALLLLIIGRSLAAEARVFLGGALRFDREALLDPGGMAEALSTALFQALFWCLPFFAVGMIGVFAAPLLFGGWNYSTKALKPDLKKLDPIAGVKRIFSMNALMELFKAIVKFLLLGGMAVAILWGWRERVLSLGVMDLNTGVAEGLQLCVATIAALCIGLALIAAVDVPFQYFSHRKKLKMTLQEVKDEMKETEGRPEVKQQIRQMQQDQARRRMAQQIPEASVVLNNPSHFSVALRYDPEGQGAPVVVAKGADHLAEVIRDLARENKVPQLRIPALARALYRHVDVDQEIPGGLYLAVAQVLSYIFALAQNPQQVGEEPDPEVPAEYRWSPED